MKRTNRLTEGNILHTLIRFAVPVFFTLFLQALYGGVDLLVVGQFAATADVSGVATGSMLMSTVTMVITGLSMGITILVGERIGRGEPDEAGRAIGGGICLFAAFGVLLTVVLLAGAEPLARLLHAPEEAFAETVEYIRICGGGSLFIVAYNVLGAVFRGIGDARTPLFTVMLACVINIGGDLLLVEGFHLGAAGAALATVAAQAVSVVVSLAVIQRRKDRLPFHFSRRSVRFDGRIIALELRLGLPVALQELLVGTSFLVIQTIVNTFGVTASAGVGVAEKVCVFLMLVSSAYMHSMSAFVAQNMGAGQPRRAKRALGYGILTAFAAGLVMAWLAFFHGDTLSLLFAKDAAVAAASHSYLKAYAIDCMLTPFLFCFMGYYNGCEKTLFVMIQGIIGAFGVRIPIAYLVSRIPGATLFQIGLGTPASSTVQIVLCLAMFLYLERRQRHAKVAQHLDGRGGEVHGVDAGDVAVGGEELGEADDKHHRGVLDVDDEVVADLGHDIAQGLGEDDIHHGLYVAHADSLGPLGLAGVNGEDAAADRLGHVGAGIDGDHQKGGGPDVVKAHGVVGEVGQAVVEEHSLEHHGGCPERPPHRYGSRPGAAIAGLAGAGGPVDGWGWC